ncbi:MAG: heparinase II/III family protein [Clostridia bacterium]|nr:heparinase II/III family protein [Clostridia bacterium]MBQ7391006.1 heparinase II/III family protein [Clostridia bacterium]
MNLLGRGADPSFWQGLTEKKEFARYVRELNNYWKKEGESYEISVLPYSKWKLFWETGDRGEYESLYFSRRRLIEHALPLSLIYPDKTEYVDKLTDVVFAILDEYTWCLPAHQDQNVRNDNSRVDLFASETAFHLALIYTLLGDRLEPLIRDRIRVEVRRRVFDTILSCDSYGWWETGKTNWTAVCTGSVGCAMMLLEPELMDEYMTERLTRAMDGFLSGFEDDGVCTEGCGYWGYGVSYFVYFADMLKTFTDGRIDYFKREKMRAIATFPQKMFLSGKSAVSFADGNLTLEYLFAVMHRLKDEYPEDVLIYSPDFGSFSGGCGRLEMRLFGAIWLNADYYNNPADSDTSFEEYAQNAMWLTKRTPSYGFAAKAGHNAEMHNHNDVGSFIFAKGGRQILADVGSGVYSRQYFGKERYTIFEPSSRSHSLPLIDGEEQFVGRDAAARDVVYERGSFSMDIAGAYSTGAVRSIKRSFVMDDESVTLTDVFERTRECRIVERLVTFIEPEMIGDRVIRIGDCTLEIYGDASVSVGTEKAAAGTCYLIDFALADGTDEFKVVMK